MENDMDNDVDFAARQQELNEFLANSEPSTENQHDILMSKHMFKFISINIDKLNQTIAMDDVLKALHHSLRLELQRQNSFHVGSFVCALLNANKDKEEKCTQICLQILYQILKTLSVDDTQKLQIGNEIFQKLIEILLSNNSTANNANILACLKLYVSKFNAISIVNQLWSSIKNSLNTNEITENTALLQTLIHFFDEFLMHIKDFRQSTEFIKFVQCLLDSEHHDHRKSAYFLLKKAHHIMDEQLMNRLAERGKQESKRTMTFWGVCITNFENLEENQSHLMLPTLEKLKALKCCNISEQIWLNLLYRQILRHNNIMVRRFILEYLLDHITYSSLTIGNQSQFMLALNETALYNTEGYMLPSENIERFLLCNNENFLITLGKVNWKAVPLHYWLTQLILHWKTVNSEDVSLETLLELASKIRAMQNRSLRLENIKLFEKLFAFIIKDMEIAGYVTLVEALYNTSDPYENEEFCKKLNSSKIQNLDGDRIFSLRFYNILTNNTKFFDNICNDLIEKIEIYGWTIGYLRFLIFDCEDNKTNELMIKAVNGNNPDRPLQEMSLKELNNFFDTFAKTEVEKSLTKQKIIDLYVIQNISSYGDLEKNSINPIDLLNDGSIRTLQRLTFFLSKHLGAVEESVLKGFLNKFAEHFEKNKKSFDNICDDFMMYIKLKLPDKVEYWNMMIFHINVNSIVIFDVSKKIEDLFSNDILLEGVLMGNAKVGDSRIEESYECKILQRLSNSYLVRKKFLEYIKAISNRNKNRDMITVLCKRIEEINSKKKRYFSDSKEHRMITRILSVIVGILSVTPATPTDINISMELWRYLMKHNNQKNVKILYEIAIVATTPYDIILSDVEEQLKNETYTSSQQLSIIAILYRTFMLKSNPKNTEILEKISFLLWPLTMGPDYQTRLYAQLAMSALIDDFAKTNQPMPEGLRKLKTILNGILTEAHISDFKNDIRFKEVSLETAFDQVMAFTNAPYDEYDFISFPSSKTEILPNNANTSTLGNLSIQRKLNPTTDFMQNSNLKSYPDSMENVLYVVASLIDKIPNLGGIARTCEVLGIKNLVIDSKAHTAKPDFQNLSMTAEKNLEIQEVKPVALMDFILQKKTEGFKIIGAEQTANSCSFVNFTFPKRSVLLLGHEKEGIPPNLLGFLDYAVEIPQFGMIRSLNVHVTGALFMWEYCKQHIVKPLETTSVSK